MRNPPGFTLILNIFMAVLVLAMGLGFLFTDFLIEYAKGPTRRLSLALLFFAYSGFRFWRVWTGIQKEKRDKQRDEWNKKTPNAKE